MMHNSNEANERFDLVVAETLSELAVFPRSRLGRVDLTTVDVDDIAVFDPQRDSVRTDNYSRR